MGWTLWLVLGTSLLGLYLLGLVAYRVYLNTQSLKQNILKARGLIAEAQQFEELAVEPAIPSSSQELSEVLQTRKRLLRRKLERQEARQRRLVERISEIEIDKGCL